MTPKDALRLVRRTVVKWNDDDAPTMAASLAYFTVFSIAPIVIISVAVAGLVFGDEAARGQLHTQLRGLVGDAGAGVIEQMTRSAAGVGSGVLATLVGAVILLFGASGVFVGLQNSLNRIWAVKPDPQRSGVWNFIRNRFLSFAMVLGIGFLLLVSLVLSAVLSALGAYFEELVPGWEVLWQIVNLVVSFTVVTTLFAMIYKILPDTAVRWTDVWLGAAVTSALFSLGKLLIGLYLGRSSISSSYGAAGSFVVVLVWVYYSSQIVLLGAEFTQVFSTERAIRRQAACEKQASAAAASAQSAPAPAQSAPALGPGSPAHKTR